MLEELAGERRVARVRINGEERWIDAADAGLYRDALGAAPPGGLPAAFLEDVPDALLRLVRRFAATHGPFTTAEFRARYGIDASAALRELERDGVLVRGELRPGGSSREWCDPEVLRRLRRASLAVLRKEIEPAEQRELARFLPAWQGVDRHPPSGAGVDRLREVLVPLQGLALPADVWERDVLPRRVGRLLARRGWTSCARAASWSGSAPARSDATRAGSRSTSARTWRCSGAPPYRGELPSGEQHEAIRARLAAGACFFTDLLVDVALSPEEIQEALWDLAWAGVATNDAFAPLRAPRLTLARAQREHTRRATARRGRFGAGRRRGGAAAQVQGRWSLTEPLLRAEVDPAARRRALGELLLERYGIVTREQVLAEGIPGGFSAIYSELSQLETLGIARRGYFLEGLGGAQFALPGAVERLRAAAGDDEARPLVLAAVDPAQPYGAALPWPKRRTDAGRRPPARPAPTSCWSAATRSCTSSAAAARCRRSSSRDDARLEPALAALVEQVRAGAIKRLALEKVDGEAAMGSPLAPALTALGFQEGPRRLTLSA